MVYQSPSMKPPWKPLWILMLLNSNTNEDVWLLRLYRVSQKNMVLQKLYSLLLWHSPFSILTRYKLSWVVLHVASAWTSSLSFRLGDEGSVVGNASRYNSSSCMCCHLGALCRVFVGHGSCFCESGTERGVRVSSPQHRPVCSESGDQLIDHWAPGGRTVAVGGMGEHNHEMYSMDIYEAYTLQHMKVMRAYVCGQVCVGGCR